MVSQLKFVPSILPPNAERFQRFVAETAHCLSDRDSGQTTVQVSLHW
ncbi:hypothetical protein [Stenomitos frigidus]|nr:hypothetical protein [Stenomitos frigidus]